MDIFITIAILLAVSFIVYKSFKILERYEDEQLSVNNDYWERKNRDDRHNAIVERVRNALLRGET